jgi:integrase
MSGGKSLKSERGNMTSRFQRGSVIKRGKVWYGVFREDVKTVMGLEREQKWVRLGTSAELPTKNAARNKLADLMKDSTPRTDMSFADLTERWEKADGPTLKITTLSKCVALLRQPFLPPDSSESRMPLHGFFSIQPQFAAHPSVRLSTALTPEQVNSLSEKLHEPYATLVLFLAATGLRIGEAIAVKWSDFDGNVLHVTRRICDGDVDTVKTGNSARKLPIDPTLIARMRQLGNGEYIFRSREGTPINPGNALRRYVRPAATELGLQIGVGMTSAIRSQRTCDGAGFTRR